MDHSCSGILRDYDIWFCPWRKWRCESFSPLTYFVKDFETQQMPWGTLTEPIIYRVLFVVGSEVWASPWHKRWNFNLTIICEGVKEYLAPNNGSYINLYFCDTIRHCHFFSWKWAKFWLRKQERARRSSFLERPNWTEWRPGSLFSTLMPWHIIFSGMDMSVRCLPQVHNQSLGRVRDVQMGEGERARERTG